MFNPKPKKAYLAEMKARNLENQEMVEELFSSLDQDVRSWQPAEKEWSVDQCFEHLIIAFNNLVPNIEQALSRPESKNSDGIFRHSFWARRLFGKIFDPETGAKTINSNNPISLVRPELTQSVSRYRDQQDRLAEIIDQASLSDLQTMCWYFKPIPIRFNLGDYLYNFVAHDALHIDQARRVLEAYRQHAGKGAG